MKEDRDRVGEGSLSTRLAIIVSQGVQTTALGVIVLLGLWTLGNPDDVIQLYQLVKDDVAPIRKLPFVTHPIEALPYREVEAIVTISWAFGIAAMVATIISSLRLLLAPPLQIPGQANTLKNLVRDSIHKRIFIRLFDGSSYWKSDPLVLSTSSSDHSPRYTFELLALAMRDETIRDHAIRILLIIVLSVWLTSLGPGGPLTSTRATFCFGYPILILVQCIVMAEVSIWTLALIISKVTHLFTRN